MEQKLRIAVYGDSLMKGTLPDEQLRYHFHTDLFEAPLAGVDAEVTNKSVFGATSRKGVTLVQRDLARGHRYDWALIEYGGNDCNYDWADVAAHPEQHHDPVVLADEFRANLTTIVQMLREAGVRPIFTTLPPIDEVKYLACIDHNGASAAGVMQWLGDVRRIYRTQERYSGLVCTIAAELDVPCVDPRDRFLDGVDPRASNAEDGIHLSEAGYALFYTTLIEQVRAVIGLTTRKKARTPKKNGVRCFHFSVRCGRPPVCVQADAQPSVRPPDRAAAARPSCRRPCRGVHAALCAEAEHILHLRDEQLRARTHTGAQQRLGQTRHIVHTEAAHGVVGVRAAECRPCSGGLIVVRADIADAVRAHAIRAVLGRAAGVKPKSSTRIPGQPERANEPAHVVVDRAKILRDQLELGRRRMQCLQKRGPRAGRPVSAARSQFSSRHHPIA